MGYREPSNATFVNFSGDKAIKKIEGLYRGYTTVPSSYGGVTKIQSFDNGGEIVSVYSKGQLDYKLQNIPNGTWVRVTCGGKEAVEIVDKDTGKKIKTQCYQFTVEIDDERSEVKGTAAPETDEEIPY